MNIPKNHIDLCRAIAALARDHGAGMVNVVIKPGFNDVWRDDISMRWEQGRHGDNADKLFIHSTVMIHAKISEEPQPAKSE